MDNTKENIHTAPFHKLTMKQKIFRIIFWITVILVILVYIPIMMYNDISEADHRGLILYFGVLAVSTFLLNKRRLKIRPNLDYDMETRIFEKSAMTTLTFTFRFGMFFGIIFLVIDFLINSSIEFSILYVVSITILLYTSVIYIVFVLTQNKPIVESEQEGERTSEK